VNRDGAAVLVTIQLKEGVVAQIATRQNSSPSGAPACLLHLFGLRATNRHKWP
jgi:hypothetical protein